MSSMGSASEWLFGHQQSTKRLWMRMSYPMSWTGTNPKYEWLSMWMSVYNTRSSHLRKWVYRRIIVSMRGSFTFGLLLFNHNSKFHAICWMVLGSSKPDCLCCSPRSEMYVERSIVSSESSRKHIGSIQTVFNARWTVCCEWRLLFWGLQSDWILQVILAVDLIQIFAEFKSRNDVMEYIIVIIVEFICARNGI